MASAAAEILPNLRRKPPATSEATDALRMNFAASFGSQIQIVYLSAFRARAFDTSYIPRRIFNLVPIAPFDPSSSECCQTSFGNPVISSLDSLTFSCGIPASIRTSDSDERGRLHVL